MSAETTYELVKEACYVLGKDRRAFHYSEVIKYIRTYYPECKYKNNTIYLHLRGLSKNIESSKKHHPSLYRRAFLLYLGRGYFKLAEHVKAGEKEAIEKPHIESLDPEAIAKEVMEKFLGVKLEKKRLNIFGKYKEFDLVNIEKGIVGDVKYFKFKGSTPSAEFSNISEYIWLMENSKNQAIGNGENS